MNQDADDTFPAGSWLAHESGTGDSANPIELLDDAISHTGSGTAADGEIPVAGEAHIKAKIVVPSYEDTAGVRFIDQVLKYTYTS